MARAKRFAYLTPGIVLFDGYMLHVARSETYDGSENKRMARERVRELMCLKARVGTSDWQFLHGIRAVAVSYGNAVTRNNTRFSKLEESAERERSHEERRLSIARSRIAWMRVFMRYGLAALLGVVGFQIAQVVGQFVPDWISTETGEKTPPYIVGIALFFITRYVAQWYADMQLRLIENRYNERLLMIAEMHDKQDESEFEDHWRQLVKLWEDYTGECIPKNLPSYMMVLKNRAKSQLRLRKQRHQLRANDIYVLFVLPFKKLAAWRRRQKLLQQKNGSNGATAKT